MKEKFELYKVRDLGDRINLTFSFIKQNGKQIAQNFLYLIPIYIIAAIITGSFQASIYSGSFYGNDPLSVFYSSAYLMSLLASIVAATASFVAVIFIVSFIAEYEESEDGTVENSKVWNRTKSSFWGCFGGAILVGLAVFIGLMLCVIPGIWLAVSFSLFITVYIVDRNKQISAGVTDSIGESYDLIKQDWFGSFGYLFVLGLISFAFGLVLSMPTMFVSVFSVFVPDIPLVSTVLSAIAYSLSYMGRLLVSIITSVAIALLYFDLKERKEGLSMHKQIENIGQPEL